MKQASARLSRHQRRHGVVVPHRSRDPLRHAPRTRAILTWGVVAIVGVLILTATLIALQ